MSFIDITLADPKDTEKRFKECAKCDKFKEDKDKKTQTCLQDNVDLNILIVFGYKKCPLDKWLKI